MQRFAAVRTREIYRNPNGDRWLLARDPDIGRSLSHRGWQRTREAGTAAPDWNSGLGVPPRGPSVFLWRSGMIVPNAGIPKIRLLSLGDFQNAFVS